MSSEIRSLLKTFKGGKRKARECLARRLVDSLKRCGFSSAEVQPAGKATMVTLIQEEARRLEAIRELNLD